MTARSKPLTAEELRLSQCKKIRKYLESGKVLTPLVALNKFGVMRLSGRIYDLRNDHHLAIKTEMPVDRKTGKRYAHYSLQKAA